MAKRSTGKVILTPQVREWLEQMVAEARLRVYGEAGCPVWGTSFAEIEDDSKEIGHEFIRLLMQQTADGQTGTMPAQALTTNSGEVAQPAGTESRTIETESGCVTWEEPKAYLPQSRKAFFPSVEGTGLGS